MRKKAKTKAEAGETPQTPRFNARDTIYWSHDHSTTALVKEAYKSASVCGRCVYFRCSLKKYKLLFLSPDCLENRIEIWCSASLKQGQVKLLKKGISSNEIWKDLNQ